MHVQPKTFESQGLVAKFPSEPSFSSANIPVSIFIEVCTFQALHSVTMAEGGKELEVIMVPDDEDDGDDWPDTRPQNPAEA